MADNTILYLKFAKRVDLMLSFLSTHYPPHHHHKGGKKFGEVMDMLMMLMVLMSSWVYTYPQTHQVVYIRDFPGGLVVKNPPSNAGDRGSIPGGGNKIPRAAGQLSLLVTTSELVPQ